VVKSICYSLFATRHSTIRHTALHRKPKVVAYAISVCQNFYGADEKRW
jgi:hypothetical protein